MDQLYISSHTIEFKVDGVLYLFNPLSGALDCIEDPAKQREWKCLKGHRRGSLELVKELESRGHLYRDQHEEIALANRLCHADSVGRSDFIVGRYIPSLQLDASASDLWRHTDPLLHNPGCAVCPVRPCCGGGCWFRRICAVGSPAHAYCTEQVRPVLDVGVKYLHRVPEVFELDTERPHPRG